MQADKKAFHSLLDEVGNRDPKIRQVLDQHGYPAPRRRENSFTTMLRIIVSQQLSTRVANVIWERLENLCAGAPDAASVLALDEQAMRDCGLSRQKISYARDLAEHIHSGRLSPVALADMPTEEVILALTRVRGYGVWSAEIYAMFALGRPDIFPAGDLALRIALQRLEALPERPDEKQAREIAQRWSPNQSAVAVLLWHYYGAATLD